MDLKTLANNFGVLVDAPNGLANLRKLILEKFVFQAGRSEVTYSTEQVERILFQDAITLIRGITFPASEKRKTQTDGTVPCVRTANVQDRLKIDDLLYIKRSFVRREEQWVKNGDVLISLANSRELVGKVCLAENVPHELTLGGFVGLLRSIKFIPGFLLYLFRTPTLQATMRDGANQTTNIANVSLRSLSSLDFPLPSKEEQHRIVAKVDHLMSLCDELEQKKEKVTKTRTRLNTVSLEKLVASRNSDEFGKNWGRVRENFDLVSSQENVESYKQAILQLAVRGLLGTTNRYYRLASSKVAVSDLDHYVGKNTISLPANAELLRATLPDSWTLVSFGELARSIRYGTSKKCTPIKKQHAVLRIPNIVEGKISLTDLKFTELSTSEYEELALEEGDLLFIRSNGSRSLVGRCAAVTQDAVGYAYAGYLIRVRLDVERAIPEYVFLCMESRLLREQIELPVRTTTGVKNINSRELSNLLIPLPPLKDQKRIATTVHELFHRCNSLHKKLKDATALSNRVSLSVWNWCVTDNNRPERESVFLASFLANETSEVHSEPRIQVL